MSIIFEGYLEIVQLLLQLDNIPVNFKDEQYQQTPLGMAASKSTLEPMTTTLEKQNLGRLKILKLLLRVKDIDVNLKNHYGNTALHAAVDTNNVEAVSLLLERKDIDVNLQNNDGESALNCAVYRGRQEIIALLKAHQQTTPSPVLAIQE